MRNNAMMRILAVLLTISGVFHCSNAQIGQTQEEQLFTRADSLRGMWSAERSCYDITYYDLDIRVDPAEQWVGGSNTIRFQAVEPFETLQIDLFDNMEIEEITLDGSSPLKYEREYGAVFVRMPRRLAKDSMHDLRVSYSGNPIVAKRPPWDGGFTWTEDQEGNPWVAVTCQGTGASLWWPNKDHQADEPDSMMIRIAVPPGLENISNGRLRQVVDLPDGWRRFDWFVSYPINNYNVTVNIGKYAHFREEYHGQSVLTLDYYVKPYNLEKAKVQFEQVKPMMECFESKFGPYPFPRDGYKLIESPHLGMEHQSAVAYGNDFLQGYHGRGSSAVGVKFDFIIIHESAHEWWGNSVTSKDIADMWIHESFGAYSEAVYVECLFGYEEAMIYVNGKRQNVRNQSPIVGTYGVNKRGAGDMYDKGQLVLNTLRHVIDNDSLWYEILKALATKFRYQTINAKDVFELINFITGSDLTYFFDQYFRFAKIPTFQVSISQKGDLTTIRHRWVADIQGFRMPLKVQIGGGDYSLLHPTQEWQALTVNNLDPMDFRIASDRFYCDVKKTVSYVDPKKSD
jgi:aminopeptidase N